MNKRTEQNLETIKGIYAAFGKGDVPSILAKLSDDVEWEVGARSSDIPWLVPGRGKAAASSFFGALQALDFHKFEVLSVMGEGPWVVALTALEATYRPTGRRLVETCEAHVWRFDADGKIVSMRHAADTRHHAEVAGV